MNPRVALVQMVSSQSIEPSLQRAEILIRDAVAGNPDAIFLPENFAALGSNDPQAIGLREQFSNGPVRSFLAEMAREAGCWIFGGTVPVGHRPDGRLVPDGRVRAASLVYNPSGVEVSRYDKIHMFDVEVEDNHKSYRESSTFEAGTDIVFVDCPFGRIGLTVCYDLRFPELYRKLFVSGVDMFTVPSAFTTITGDAHFKLLLRARAVENSCFCIAACQGGQHDSGRRTYGHSMVISPWGDVLGELGEGEGVLAVELDLASQAQLRKDMPFIDQCQILGD